MQVQVNTEYNQGEKNSMEKIANNLINEFNSTKKNYESKSRSTECSTNGNIFS
jgi:hypothetical protein